MASRDPSGSSGEVLFEFTQIGQQMRVAAIDGRTSIEVVVIAPVTASAVGARASATFQNCTFTRNVASAVGGINVIVQPITLINTIVSGNLDPNGNPSDIEKGGTGSINTAGSFNNLIGAPGGTGLTNGTNGNLVGVLDPKVVPPANYGGPVPTVPIRPSSPARTRR